MADAGLRPVADPGSGALADGEPIAGGGGDPAPLPEDGVPEAVVEPGRMLALTDFSPPSLSAGERLVRLAYGLGLRGRIVDSFRKPARKRLLATVLNPLPGDKVAGTALRAGHFLLHGVKLPIVQADLAGVARMTPPLERHVHGFTWLADL